MEDNSSTQTYDGADGAQTQLRSEEGPRDIELQHHQDQPDSYFTSDRCCKPPDASSHVNHRRNSTISAIQLEPGSTVVSKLNRRLSLPGGIPLGDIQITRRKSRNYNEAGSVSRRRSLAYSDLMAVFYPPNMMRQHTMTETPFECPELENHDKREDLGALKDVAKVEEVDDKIASWEPTLERAIKSIVSIKAQCVRSFDTETSGTYTATGFVVDSEAGLILSNRHVVNPAPIVAQAIFVNYEEVELQPVYRDPVHDFGFFRFNPKQLKFMQPESIKLAPHKAKVGMEIRVVGNDAGEKLSILAGTLARLDRMAPEYGVGEYNDFNTFYLQAASGTSGGSSGSPVLDIFGDAVALNAGGSSKAASSFYLPLNRVVRALDYVRKGEQVPRGTIQTELEHLPYDELRRLGLDVEIEKKMREWFPESQGMLAIRDVLPKGPAHGTLRSGDIVVAINSKPTIDFVGFEEVTDSSVGAEIVVSVWRGNKAYDVRAKVQDMHSITPDRLVEVGGGVANELSYQMARSYGIPVGGVYIASSGHVFGSGNIWRGSVVLSVGDVQTPTLDEFARSFSKLQSGSRVPVRYISLSQPYKERVTIMNVSTHWHALRMATRDVTTGWWNYKDLEAPRVESRQNEPQTALLRKLPKTLSPADKIWPSIVHLDFYIPYLVDGMSNSQYIGPGIIIDRKRGFIMCDRDTVPIGLGDVYITIANSIVITGKVWFMHPVYNFSIIKYNPEDIGDTPVKDIEIGEESLDAAEKLKPGDTIHLVAVSNDQNPITRRTEVSARGMVSTRECLPPRFRVTNTEGIKLYDQPPCQGGVLCDAKGTVRGLWANVTTQDANHKETSMMAGFDIALMRPTIDALRRGTLPNICTLDVELWVVSLAAARTLGLSAARIRQFEAECDNSPQPVHVLGHLTNNSAASEVLKTGDLILEKDGRLVTDINDVGILYDTASVDLVVLRAGTETHVRVPTTRLAKTETDWVVYWSGAIVQRPYRAVQEQVRSLPSGAYVSCTLFGSPANCFGLRPGMWITEIENRPVRTLEHFVEIVKDLGLDKTAVQGGDGGTCGARSSGRYVRITVVNRNETTRVLSLRVDNHYWPPWQLVSDDSTVCGWRAIHSI